MPEHHSLDVIAVAVGIYDDDDDEGFVLIQKDNHDTEVSNRMLEGNTSLPIPEPGSPTSRPQFGIATHLDEQHQFISLGQHLIKQLREEISYLKEENTFLQKENKRLRKINKPLQK